MRTRYLAVVKALIVAAAGCGSEPATSDSAPDATTDTRADDALVSIDTSVLDTGALDVIADEGATDATDATVIDDGSSDAPVVSDGSADVIDAGGCTLAPVDVDAGVEDAGTGYCVCTGTGCGAPVPCPAGNVCVFGVGCRRRSEICDGVPCGSIFCAGPPLGGGDAASLCWSASQCVVSTSAGPLPPPDLPVS